MFYTRIPIAKTLPNVDGLLENCTKYFTIVGLIVGLVGASSFFVSSLFLSVQVSTVLSIIATILTTGAFHEDGLADVCDAFGGGWTKEKILVIMKDSRVGAYGLIGLVCALLLKFCLLLQLASKTKIMEFSLLYIFAHVASRFMVLLLMYKSQYVRENEDSKAKPLAKQMDLNKIAFAAVPLFFVSAFFKSSFFYLFLCLILPLILVFYLNWYFKKWIGGYTGDCLGATQQITEIAFYINLLLVWKFI